MKPIVSEINENDMVKFIRAVEDNLIISYLNYRKENVLDERMNTFFKNVGITIIQNGSTGINNAKQYIVYINNHIFGARHIEHKKDGKNNVENQIEVLKNKAKEIYNFINNTDKCVNVSLYKKSDNDLLEFQYLFLEKDLDQCTSQYLLVPKFNFINLGYFTTLKERNIAITCNFGPNEIMAKQNLDVVNKIVPIVELNTGKYLNPERRDLLKLILSVLWRNVDKRSYNNGENFTYSIYGGLYDFYANVDAGHDSEHIFNVLLEAFKISNIFMFFYTQEEAFKHYLTIGLACLAHDMFSAIDRDNHHILAGQYLMDLSYVVNKTLITDEDRHIDYWMDCFKYFTKDMLIEASQMVSEHRASYKGQFSNKGSEILSAADRGKPDIYSVVNRIYTCAMDSNYVFEVDKKGYANLKVVIGNHLYNSVEIIDKLTYIDKWTEQQIKTFYHLWEKYSRNGYAFSNLDENGVYFQYYKEDIYKFWNIIDSIIGVPELMIQILTLK